MMDLYARRRLRNRIVMVLSYAATGVGLGWLALILGTLLFEGASGLSLKVFTEMTPPPGADGGLLNPIKMRSDFLVKASSFVCESHGACSALKKPHTDPSFQPPDRPTHAR